MANTITDLFPYLYASLDIVSRELVGIIPCAMRDPTLERAAVGQNVLAFKTSAASATDITPGVTPPDDGDQTVNNVAMAITAAKRVPFRWNGEQTRALNNNGAGANAIKGDQITQAFRTLCNLIEADGILVARKSASRAYGTAGTAPFGTNLGNSAQVRKILDDNGAPPTDRCIVIDTTAGASLRTLAQLTKVNEAGTSMTLRDGELMNIHNFSFHESGQLNAITAGTGATYQLNGVHAVGATSIAVDTGTGTILAGDTITIANGTPADTNKYVVVTTLAAGVVVIAKPGLKCAHIDNDAVTVGAAYTPNLAFARSSLVLATRAPALPDEDDMADDRQMIVDPRSGIAFEIALYKQYRQVQYEVSVAWGWKQIKEEHAAIMLG